MINRQSRPSMPPVHHTLPLLSTSIKCGVVPSDGLLRYSLIPLVFRFPDAGGVKLPTRDTFALFSVNHIVPVAESVWLMPYGLLPADGVGVSENCWVFGLKRPILLPSSSVNRILPYLSKARS